MEIKGGLACITAKKRNINIENNLNSPGLVPLKTWLLGETWNKYADMCAVNLESELKVKPDDFF